MFFNRVDILKKESLNKSWKILFEEKKLTIPSFDFSAKDSFFTIGSCFAENVRVSIQQKNSGKCFPDYLTIDFDKNNEIIDRLNLNINHMSHYSPVSILQEFKRSMTHDQSFTPIKIPDVNIINGKKIIEYGSCIYQDPYRREVYSKNEDQVISLSNKINFCIKNGLENSKVFIITLQERIQSQKLIKII